MLNFHKKEKDFLEAIRKTSQNSGFSEILIEKDYYCSLLLKEIFRIKDYPFSWPTQVVFKGGTLLNKCYAGFYRLSEDLDFSISDKPKTSRKQRSSLAKKSKEHVIDAVKKLSLDFSKEFEGHNENRLYSAEITYHSLITGIKNTIKIEFGIHEKVWERESLMAKTLLKNPLTQKPIVPDFNVQGLSLKEAYSEKIRAALSREKPAIRDIFDIHYAIKKRLIAGDRCYIKIHDISPMLKYKLKTLNCQIDLSDERKKEFLSQMETELKPVLRQKDFEEFNFEQAWNWLKILEQKISESL